MALLLILLLNFVAGVGATTGCGTGYYEDQDSCECDTCPVGTYNDQESAELCTSCPSGWTTLQTGSTGPSYCRLICGKGYYAARTGPSTNNRTCMICPRGSYSDTNTASSCIQCPSGQTTVQEGSTNSSNCQPDYCFMNNPCSENGQCVNGVNEARCVCNPGFVGNHCQYVDYCFGNNNPCSANGQCVNPIGANEAQCVCNHGFGGNFCQYVTGCNTTVSVTDTTQYIATDGISLPVNYIHGQHCPVHFEAPPGRTIVLFFDFDNRTTQRFDSNSVTLNFTHREFLRYLGIHIGYVLNGCDTSPCENGATCVAEIDGFKCMCTNQWLGDTCAEFNNCYPDQCINGTCTDGDNTYTCSCFDGYKGTNCDEINSACANVTCQNGGSCIFINETNNAVCVCSIEFTGMFCEEVICGIAPIFISRKRIVGGVEAVAHAWPWQVSFQRNGSHRCGGSIISSEFIVTAAHCFPRPGETILLGAHDVTNCQESEGCLEVQVVDRWIHEDYLVSVRRFNDIAVVKFSPPLNQFTDTIFPLCLPQSEDEDRLPIGTFCTAIGWGAGSNSSDLYQVHMELVSQRICDLILSTDRNPWNQELMICAGDAFSEGSTCGGDSGGPLMCQVPGEQSWKMFGVTAFGFACVPPGGFTRVIHYLDWIQNILDQED